MNAPGEDAVVTPSPVLQPGKVAGGEAAQPPDRARPTFYLIDGHAQIYRAYFAPFRDLTAPDGTPVKATYVFAQMLLNLVAAKRPDYLAMVIDAAGDEGLHRKEIYPEYKANRQARPDDFGPQEDRILALVRDAGIPIYHLPGYEADDVLATLARRLEAQGFDVVLVSKDKDLRQLLTGHVRMYDVHTDTFTTPESLEAELGFTPAQAVEIQSLMGDKIDNVPGIPGVGDKTAVELIKQFGSAQAVIDRADEIKKPKLRESAKAFKEQLPITRQLVTLHTDLTVPDFDLTKCQFQGLHTDAIKQHFTQLGFTSLLRRIAEMEGKRDPLTAPGKVNQGAERPTFSSSLFGDSGPAAVEGAHPQASSTPLSTSEGLDYRLINTPELFASFLQELGRQRLIAFDSETDGLGAMYSEPIGFSFSWAEGSGYYIAIKGPPGEAVLDRADVIAGLKPAMENPAIAKVGHNVKYDLLVMRRAGINVRGVVADTMVEAFVLDASRLTYGIDKLAEQLLGFKKIATTELIGVGKSQVSMDRVSLERTARYASEDADICLRLHQYLRPRLEAVPALRKLADEVETPVVEVLTDMEFHGIAVDPVQLKEQSRVLGERIEELRRKIGEAAGGDGELGGAAFNPDSTKQLQEVLFNRLKLKPIKKTKTGYSTDSEVLERLADQHPVPGLILDYRSLVKLKNTYLDNLTEYISPKTGRIHTHFNPTGAATGRLSSSDPNLQNIPIRTDEGRRIRLAFIPENKENVLLAADYSQIELRILAHYTQEPALLRAFEADEDIHRAVASEVFGVPLDQVTKDQRGQAKTINFGIIYGVTAFGLSRRIEGLSTGAAEKLIRDYNARFPSIEKFLNQCVEQARTLGYVETLLGRRRPLPDIHSNTLTIRNAAERMAINSVVQGSAADLIKLAMLKVHKRITDEARPSRMLLQVHDELVFETPKAHVEEEAEMIRHEMVGAMKLDVPLKVEVGWGETWGAIK